jgi:hypothetical protein
MKVAAPFTFFLVSDFLMVRIIFYLAYSCSYKLTGLKNLVVLWS